MSLFKYIHPDRTDFLKNGSIRFSTPKSLNDPFELKPQVSASKISEIISKSIPAALHHKINLEKINEDLTLRIYKGMEELGILCLTESDENLLMWAHYANSHQGFVVEFDEKNDFFKCRYNNDNPVGRLTRVKYTDTRPVIDLTNIEVVKSLPETIITKSKEWSYEQEWRFVLPIKNADKIIKNGSEIIYLFNYQKSSIKSITFGCMTSKEKKSEIIEIIKSSHEYKNTIIKEARIDKKSFKINIKEI
ncbi:MAG TPA: DUF2971 domain-containing protein, partial [Ignavibacteriaceae bacterium]